MAAITAPVRYRVTAALAILPDETQGQIYLQPGDLVPASTPEPVIRHLVDSHIISPVVQV